MMGCEDRANSKQSLLSTKPAKPTDEGAPLYPLGPTTARWKKLMLGGHVDWLENDS